MKVEFYRRNRKYLNIHRGKLLEHGDLFHLRNISTSNIILYVSLCCASPIYFSMKFLYYLKRKRSQTIRNNIFLNKSVTVVFRTYLVSWKNALVLLFHSVSLLIAGFIFL